MTNSTCKTFVYAFVISITFVVTLSIHAQERTWRDKTGKFEVVAELIEIVDGKAILKKKNGNTIKVPVVKFSDADKAYLKSLNAPETPPAESPPAENPPPKNPPPKNPPPSETPPTDSPKPEPPATQPPTNEPQPSADPSPPMPTDSETGSENTEPPATTTPAPVTPSEPANVEPKPAHVEKMPPPSEPEPAPPVNVPDPAPPVNVPEPSPNVENVKPSPIEPEKAAPVIARPIKLEDRTNDVVPELAIPEINVSEEQIAALPERLAKIGRALVATKPIPIRQALDDLDADWPGQNPTILNLVRKCTMADEKFCRLKAIRLLGTHNAIESFPYILARLDDKSQDVRWTAINIMEEVKDTRAISPLVERFAGKERAKISSALMAFGAEPEPQLFFHLTDRRAEVRMETSLLLGKLGSEKSIPYLQQLAAGDPNPVVSLQAKSAIRNINRRIEEAKIQAQQDAAK